MGRPGRGSGGGSRGGGSRRVGSSGGGSSRPGRGTSRGPSKSMGGGFGGGPRHYGGPVHHGPRHHHGHMHHHGMGHHHHHHHHRSYVSRPRNVVSELITTVAVIIIFVIFLAFTKCDNEFARKDRQPGYNNSYENSYNGNSTKKRKKANADAEYIEKCIVDECGWFEEIDKSGQKLKNFWNKTGVQPYIVLKKYDSTITTDEQKEKWAEDYYNQHIETENVFLIVYFAEKDENEEGILCYYHGANTDSVMDEEAIDIFYENIDKYWYEDISTDDVFIKAFNDTANDIM